MSAALAFSHGANDAQKAVGVIAALLLAAGQIDSLAAPLWATVACSLALTLGTALGGWRIIRTVGRRIYRVKPVDGLATESASAGVIFGASLLGAPTSTSQVVASAVVGVGGGRRRWHHVHWAIVRQIGIAWLITMPISAVLAGGRIRVAAAAVTGAQMTRNHWFLPDEPDVLGLLERQISETLRGFDALADWAGGDESAAQAVREAEHRGDEAKREALSAVTELLRHSDRARRSVRAVAGNRLAAQPRPRPRQRGRGHAHGARRDHRRDAAMLRDALGEIQHAIFRLASDPDAATAHANAAIGPSTGSSAPITRGWRPCSRTRISATESPSASSTGNLPAG